MMIEQATTTDIHDATVPHPGGSDLPSSGEIARLVTVAKIVSSCGMPLPPNCRKWEACFTKMLAGRELGIGPMASLYELDLSSAKLSMSARMQVAIVRRRGIGEIDTIESSDGRAVVRVRRSEWEPGRWDTVEWDHARAEKAGLLKKDVWQKYERAMHVSRATSEGCHRHFQDVYLGIGYTPEELGEEVDEEGRLLNAVEQPAELETILSKAETVPKAPAAEPLSPPPPTPREPPPTEPEPDPIPDGITDSQVAQISSRHKELDPPNDVWRLLMSRWGVTSIRQLTEFNATELINHLKDVGSLRDLRDMAKIDQKSWDRAIAKRNVQSDLLLTSLNISQIKSKLAEHLTPFDRQRLGLEPEPENSTAGNPSKPAAGQPATTNTQSSDGPTA